MMKKQAFFILLDLCFCVVFGVSSAHGQALPKKAVLAAEKYAGRGPVSFTRIAGRIKGPLRLDPDYMLPGYEGKVVREHSYFRMPEPNGDKITSALTKRWLAQHRKALYQEKMRYLDKVAWLKKDAHKIPDVLREIVFQNRVPYAEIVPLDTRVLYLGEVHYQQNIPAEIKRVISDMKRRQPERDIIVMSEFWPDFVNLYGDEKNRLPRRSVSYGREVLDFVRRKGITAFGLEDMRVLYKMGHMQGIKKNEFSTSFVGMEKRNRYWARQIKDALRINKDALIIVYAGAAHVNWAFRANVPELTGEEKSFVLQFNCPDADRLINPLFQYIHMSPETQELFELVPDSKIFVSLFDKKYRPLFGYDASVTVHSAPGDRRAEKTDE